MNKKDDKPQKKGDPFYNSAQIFEDIFKEATHSVEKPKAKKAGVEEPKPATPKRPMAPPPAPGKQTAPPPPPQLRQARAPKASRLRPQTNRKEARQRQEPPLPEPTEKPSKRLSFLKIVLLVVLLAVLSGAVVNYLGIFDFPALSDLLGPEKKQPPPPALKKQVPRPQTASQPPVKTPDPTVASTKKEEGQGEEPAQQPAAPPPVQEQAVTKTTLPAPQIPIKEEKPATVVPPTPEPPKREMEKAQPEPLRQEPPHPTAQAKSSSVEPPVLLDSSARYPYSIYLGSYQSDEMVKEVLAKYREEGMPVYWSLVRLGDKGVWYRLYAGYFRSEAEARDFVSRRQLNDAEVKMTRYAVLVGVFSTRAEAEQKASILLGLGFPAYMIPLPQGKIRLYSGAFHTKQGADIAVSQLASKGIKAFAVER